MLRKLWTRLEESERKFRRSWGKDISTPSGRRWAKVHYHLFDHAFLRVFWTNFWQLSDDVWRSNQPTHGRFRKYAAMGIRTVINLRGEDKYAHYLFEKESVEQLGMTLVNTKLWAREAAPRRRIVAVIDALRTAERPMMFHCKSGADRAGFTAATYMMVFEGASVQEAKKQLGLKYIHLDFTTTGVQDYILEIYKARLDLGEIGFEHWIRSEYDAKPIQRAWDSRQAPAEIAAALKSAAEAAAEEASQP